MTESGENMILRSNAPKSIKLIVQTIHPPKDLFSYSVKEQLDVTRTGIVKRFEFSNKYVGLYDVGILLKKFSDDLYFVPKSERYKLRLKMVINFYTHNQLVKSYTVDKAYDPFVGRKEGGFSFIRYKCPENLPQNTNIICEVKILEPDNTLNINYGPIEFYIIKLSDE